MTEVIALSMGEFTFRDDDPWPGQTGVVVAYAVRHRGGVFLFDTGIGLGNAEFDASYMVRARPLPEVLERAGVDQGEITAIANCHLHADHSGQNLRFRASRSTSSRPSGRLRTLRRSTRSSTGSTSRAL